MSLAPFSATLTDLTTTIDRNIALHAFISANQPLLSDLLSLSTYNYHTTGLGRLRLYLTLPVSDFTLSADPDLSCVLSALFELLDSDCHTSSRDSPSDFLRTYRFEHPTLPLTVELSAELRPDSPLCTRIITGTRTTTRRVEVESTELTYSFKC